MPGEKNPQRRMRSPDMAPGQVFHDPEGFCTAIRTKSFTIMENPHWRGTGVTAAPDVVASYGAVSGFHDRGQKRFKYDRNWP